MTAIILMGIAGALIGLATPPLWKRPEWWAAETGVILAYIATKLIGRRR